MPSDTDLDQNTEPLVGIRFRQKHDSGAEMLHIWDNILES